MIKLVATYVRLPFYEQFTRRIKFGQNETIDQSADYLKNMLMYKHQFKSTRTNQKVDFEFVALSGLASDGGLYLPTELPPRLNLESLVDMTFKGFGSRVIFVTKILAYFVAFWLAQI